MNWKGHRPRTLLGALGALCLALPSTWADESTVTNENPYRIIAERNAFGIKPPPPPPPPVAPPTPPSNVFLTGIINGSDGKRAFFSVNRPGAKEPKYLDFTEGQSQDDITVLAIDLKAETVRIRNAGNESTLNFKDNGFKPTAVPTVPAPPGGVPGIPSPVPGAPPAPFQRPTAGTPAGGGPVVVGKRGDVQQGGAQTTPAVPTPVAEPVAAGNFTPATPTPLRELPVRRSRVDTSVPGGEAPAGSAPDGVKVSVPANFRPPLPGTPTP